MMPAIGRLPVQGLPKRVARLLTRSIDALPGRRDGLG